MKTLLAALSVTTALALTAHAEDAPAKKPAPTAEQKAEMKEHRTAIKELITKYDTNKDGKLDKDEHAKMSAEDKAKFEKMRAAAKPKEDDTHADRPAKPEKPAK